MYNESDHPEQEQGRRLRGRKMGKNPLQPAYEKFGVVVVSREKQAYKLLPIFPDTGTAAGSPLDSSEELLP